MPKRGENIRKRNDGRWEGRYKKTTGLSGKTQYRSVYGKTYSEVKRKLREAYQHQNDELYCTATDKKFKDVLLLWKETNNLKNKGATNSKYEYLIEKHIIPEIGDFKLSAITALILNEFADKKLSNGRLDKKGGLSPSYVRSMMIIITAALQYAVNEGMCTALKNPFYKPVVAKRELRVLSSDEQERLETFLTTDPNETKLGVFLSLNFGLRIGEVCALRWEDIDLDNQIIHIRNTVARVKGNSGGSALIIDSPKTKSSLRDIPIHSKLIPLITEMYRKRISSYVISNTTNFVSPRTYEYRYHRVLDECGLGSYNYHILRHTFATRCIIAGVDVKTVSEILGHSNVSITLNTYVHPSMEMKLMQIDKIYVHTA